MGTNWSAITNMTAMLSQANNYAPFWTGMLVMIFAVFLISFLSLGFIIALMSAGTFLSYIFVNILGLPAIVGTVIQILFLGGLILLIIILLIIKLFTKGVKP